MSDTIAIRAEGVSKCYALFDRPIDRLKQMLWRGRRRYYREFWAMRDVSLEVRRGEVVGLVGRNGAGKSTLLQLLCGTLQPTAGTISVQGRIAALLELGAGFNPEFSGRENIVLAASIMGLSNAEIAARSEEIIEFSGIRPFIDQPVKTYSSGMYVRLAFAVATSVDPDILVIDEALSVGDGEFARRSFDRIMGLKEAGATILFCSHSMYHIEALCSRALWLEHGTLRMAGPAAVVTAAYQASLEAAAHAGNAPVREGGSPAPAPKGAARLLEIAVQVDGARGHEAAIVSGRSTVAVTVRFASDPALPAPSLGIGIHHASGIPVASAGSVNDGVALARDAHGCGSATLILPALPLLKGEYYLSVFLVCERGIHIYDHAERCATLTVSQEGLEQGLVSLPHRWETGA